MSLGNLVGGGLAALALACGGACGSSARPLPLTSDPPPPVADGNRASTQVAAAQQSDAGGAQVQEAKLLLQAEADGLLQSGEMTVAAVVGQPLVLRLSVAPGVLGSWSVSAPALGVAAEQSESISGTLGPVVVEQAFSWQSQKVAVGSYDIVATLPGSPLQAPVQLTVHVHLTAG